MPIFWSVICVGETKAKPTKKAQLTAKLTEISKDVVSSLESNIESAKKERLKTMSKEVLNPVVNVTKKKLALKMFLLRRYFTMSANWF